MPIFVDIDNSNLNDKRFKADKDKVGDASAKAEEKMQKTVKAALADDAALHDQQTQERERLRDHADGHQMHSRCRQEGDGMLGRGRHREISAGNGQERSEGQQDVQRGLARPQQSAGRDFGRRRGLLPRGHREKNDEGRYYRDEKRLRRQIVVGISRNPAPVFRPIALGSGCRRGG
jgi:hypothetical protein